MMIYMNRPASPRWTRWSREPAHLATVATCFPSSANKIMVRGSSARSSTPRRTCAPDCMISDGGGSVRTWAREIGGLLLPDGMTPTRASVVKALSSLARPDGVPSAQAFVAGEGHRRERRFGSAGGSSICSGPQPQGRLEYRTLHSRDLSEVEALLDDWRMPDYSPGWLHDEFVEAIRRNFDNAKGVELMLMGAARWWIALWKWEGRVRFREPLPGPRPWPAAKWRSSSG